MSKLVSYGVFGVVAWIQARLLRLASRDTTQARLLLKLKRSIECASMRQIRREKNSACAEAVDL